MSARFTLIGGVLLSLVGWFAAAAPSAHASELPDSGVDPLLRFEEVDIGWADFPGGRVLRCAVADDLPVVWEVGDGHQRQRPLSLLPGRVYCDAQLELPPNRHLIWGDNSLWGGAGDLFYNGERVLTLGGGLGTFGLSLGDNVRSGGRGTVALGSWNEAGNAAATPGGQTGEWLFALGNGGPLVRSNAFAVTWHGEGWFSGGLTVGGNLGIGTRTPTVPLDVRGPARIRTGRGEPPAPVKGEAIPALDVDGDVLIRGRLVLGGPTRYAEPPGMGRFQRKPAGLAGGTPAWWASAGVVGGPGSGVGVLNLGQLRHWYLSGLEELAGSVPRYERYVLLQHLERWRSASEAGGWDDYLPVGPEDLRLLASPLLRAARAAAARGQCRLLCEPVVLAPAATAPPGSVPVATVASWFAWERVGAP